jgi:hypothetical protein
MSFETHSHFVRDLTDSSNPFVRLEAKCMQYSNLMEDLPDKPFKDGYLRIPREKLKAKTKPLANDREHAYAAAPRTFITRKQAASLLNVSRTKFSRMVDSKTPKGPRLRKQLGYTATNDRNGRFALEAVLDYAMQKHPAFNSDEELRATAAEARKKYRTPDSSPQG